MGYINRYLNNQLTELEQVEATKALTLQKAIYQQIENRYKKEAKEIVDKLITNKTKLNKLSEYVDMPIEEVVLALKELSN